MNKMIALTTALCTTAATFAGQFVTWNGADYRDSDYMNQIQTGLDNGTGTHGLWYSYEDDHENGRSSIEWPVELCHEFTTCTPHFYDDIVIQCKGLCGTAILDKGNAKITPYVGIGFNIVGEAPQPPNELVAGDASAWGGLCVTYKSDTDINLELGLGNVVDSTINYTNPAVKLPASKTGNKVVVAWSDFKQPSSYNGSVKFDGETAAKQLVGVHFKIQAEPGEYNFNICAVGPKDGTCPEECGIPTPPETIKVSRRNPTVNASLMGHTLEFTGIKSAATVEVMNSLGQVMMMGVIDNSVATLNLATLDAGIYMVRINGMNVNFAKNILLK